MHYDCLIVDDETELARMTAEYFEMFDIRTQYVDSAASCFAFFKENDADMILLDINLGDGSGFDVCKKLREDMPLPILFISARTSDDDVLIALNIGGDDYIKKPFTLSILLAKVKAILDRYEKAREAAAVSDTGTVLLSGPDTGTVPTRSKSFRVSSGSNTGPVPSGFSGRTGDNTIIPVADGISLDTGMHIIRKGDERVSLKAMEYKLLKYLADNTGRVVTKDELLKNVWDDEFIGEGTLAVHIRHLREKIESDPKDPQVIKTIWGVGYMMERYEELS